MIYTELTKKAIKLCFDAHKDQVDKAGLPYVFHPFYVAEQMTDEISTVCALLHDVVEDTQITLEDIRQMGFPKEVIEVLRLLTHDDNVDYMQYIKNIKNNPIAKKVKFADLKHNIDISRLDNIDSFALDRVKKYKEAIKVLTSESVF